MINQTNPHAAYRAYKDEVDEAVLRVLDSNRYILGNEVSSFEAEFAGFVGAAHAIGVANGTDAIELALRASGIGFGDVVATVSHTAVATASAITRVGATPLFVDIDPESYTMDPACLESVLEAEAGRNVKAVVVVHIYGQMADLTSIKKMTDDRGLVLIEDCAQAHGATQNGRGAGSIGDFGCFSFYPTKNLGAIGDGGCVVTSDLEKAEKLRMLREYGWNKSRVSECIGVNSRLDELQAAILRVKLRHLEAANVGRRRIAAIYDAVLGTAGISVPLVRAGNTHVYHQYVIRLKDRDTLREKLKAGGIETGIHYAVPVHLHPSYSSPDCMPVRLIQTEHIVSNILSLPMYPELTDDEARKVAASVVANFQE